MYRNTFVKINEDNLAHNVKELINKHKDYKYYFGVVKANAYGHGVYIIKSIIDAGVNYLAVSSLDEALNVRDYNKKIPVLCLEPIPVKYLSICSKKNITITLSNKDYYKEIKDLKLKLKIHMKIDSGMNRLGFKDKKEINKVYKELLANKYLKLEGIYTHFATSGINDEVYNEQVLTFKKLIKDINVNKIEVIHASKSATLINQEKIDVCNGVRLGIALYGVGDKDLKNAFSLHTTVMEIRKVKKGEFVGYEATYKPKKEELIACLPIGYADGINNSYKHVIINNKKYDIVGLVCMDMIMVRVDASVKVGDDAELFGNKITMKEITKTTQIDEYHLFTGISSRVDRLYNDNKKI